MTTQSSRQGDSLRLRRAQTFQMSKVNKPAEDGVLPRLGTFLSLRFPLLHLGPSLKVAGPGQGRRDSDTTWTRVSDGRVSIRFVLLFFLIPGLAVY